MYLFYLFSTLYEDKWGQKLMLIVSIKYATQFQSCHTHSPLSTKSFFIMEGKFSGYKSKIDKLLVKSFIVF